MARLPRYALAHQPQHVIQRGNNRVTIFSVDADRRFFLDKLASASLKHGCAVHAYVLMTNHVHLLVTPDSSDGIGKMMQTLGRCYVQYYNYHQRRTGTLWEGRYRATVVDSERYLLTCMRYIELNPVRAKRMARHPAEYAWSSHRHNAMGEDDSIVTPHVEYSRLGRTDDARRAAYRSLFATEIAESMLNEIRESTNKGWLMGSDRFKRIVAQQLQRPVEPAARGGDRKSAAFRKRIDRV
jgi:putative transposase